MYITREDDFTTQCGQNVASSWYQHYVQPRSKEEAKRGSNKSIVSVSFFQAPSAFRKSKLQPCFLVYEQCPELKKRPNISTRIGEQHPLLLR